MSADQTNIDSLTPLPGGGYRCVISDGSPILPLAMRIMEETGANRVRVRLAPDGKLKLCNYGFTILIQFARR